MTQWPSAKAKRVLAVLPALGRAVKRQSGSHRTLLRPGWPDVVFAFHDGDEIGPKMLARLPKHTGQEPDDLR
jgi:predicted RNA binding protein YcfA (HicA-like mRNA interferase family)